MKATFYSLLFIIAMILAGAVVSSGVSAAEKAPAKAEAKGKGKAKDGGAAKGASGAVKKGDDAKPEGKKPEAAKKPEAKKPGAKKEDKPAPKPKAAAKAAAAKGPMTAVLILKKKPGVKGAGEGGNVLGVFEYEVVEVLDGDAPGKTIRVAHGVIWDGNVTDANDREAGSTRTLELVPLSDYPGLKKMKVVGGSADGLYIPKL